MSDEARVIVPACEAWAFINTRLREIEAEKQKQREAPPAPEGAALA